MRTWPCPIAFIVRDPLPLPPLRADVARLRVQLPDVLLVIAGDAPSGDEMVWMRTAIAARGLGHHVLLTGSPPQASAPGDALWAEAGLSPLPRGGLFDMSSPTRLAEYLALGIPPAAPDMDHPGSPRTASTISWPGASSAPVTGSSTQSSLVHEGRSAPVPVRGRVLYGNDGRCRGRVVVDGRRRPKRARKG